MLGTSEAWSMSHLSLQATEPVYYIVDCRILGSWGDHIMIFMTSDRPTMLNLTKFCLIQIKSLVPAGIYNSDYSNGVREMFTS